jgi:uncharacterized repeat protein (TIGR03803 family)
MKSIIRTAALCCVLALGARAGQAATFQTVHQFRGSDGATPLGALALGSDGLFYGTTYSGGAGGGGTVFSFDPTTGALTTLHAFSPNDAGGAGPIGALLPGGASRSYGVTQLGGGTPCHSGCGTIFEINTATHKVTTLYAFSGQADGAEPSAHLTFNKARTILYGTTQLGGDIANCQNLGCGTVFQLLLATTTLTTLHRFTFADAGGAFPDTGLTIDASGMLYGAASERGANGSGTLFQLDPTSLA